MRRVDGPSDVSRNVRERLSLVVAALWIGACVRDAEQRQLDTMRDQIQDLEQTLDRDDATSTTDDPIGAAAPSAAQAPASPQTVARPTSKLGGGEDLPEAPEDGADTEDTTPRPSVRVVGAVRSSGRGAVRGDESVERSDSELGTTGHADADRALAPEAARSYDAAMALVRAKQFDKALDAFAAFLVRWPDHPYADAAMYWRGECYYARGDTVRAVEQLEGVLARYPEGGKVPDAMLKLGMAEQKLGHADRARAWFARLAQRFPESTAAHRLPPTRAADVPLPDATH
ncbi:MAG: tol-pal system protein YbgF [Polyangiaceae bacterium]